MSNIILTQIPAQSTLEFYIIITSMYLSLSLIIEEKIFIFSRAGPIPGAGPDAGA